MTGKRLTVWLDPENVNALLTWAQGEMREPDMQARFFIEQGLQRRYRQCDLPVEDVRRVIHWLMSLPILYPSSVGDALHRINAYLNEYPREERP